MAPHAPRRAFDDWWDRILGSDPGLNRLLTALHSLLSVGLAMIGAWAFVHLTHALWLPTKGLTGAALAQVTVVNHEYTVIGMMLAAIIAMMTTFFVIDPTPSGQLKTMLITPFPMIAALALGLALAPYRAVALASLVVLLAAGSYARRWGMRGFMIGQMLFMGDFFGFFLHGAIKEKDLGWLAAEMGVGILIAMVVRFGLFYPRPARALARTQRSYRARAHKVAALALAHFDDPEHSERGARRLHRQVVRLNEAALMIDGQLGDPSALSGGSSAHRLHQRLFDVELALTNIARFAITLSPLELRPDARLHVRGALQAIVMSDRELAVVHAQALSDIVGEMGTIAADQDDRNVNVVLHRFATSVSELATAMTDWLSAGADAAAADEPAAFQPAVMLFGGWLPGSVLVSAAASKERGRGLHDRVVLAPYTRTAIQITVAVGLAIILGDILSGRRFYWAVIAAFISFFGVNNSREQARKAGFRIVGTFIGVLLGAWVVHLVGNHTYVSLAVILVALFLGIYLMRINYTFMVIGITVMVSQLYVQLDEFSNSLLRLRLEETALGAAIAIIVVLFVLPLRTQQVLRVAMRAHISAVSTLVEHATGRMLSRPAELSTLRADARAVDATYQTLMTTMIPLRRTPLGRVDEQIAADVRLATATRHYARNLANDVERSGQVDEITGVEIGEAATTLTSSISAIVDRLSDKDDGVYTRSASIFDRAERRMACSNGSLQSTQLAMRDLKLIDEAMAAMAERLSLPVTDLDTVPLSRTGD